ncbi:Osmosensitive K+ channel His kinase sensor [Methanoregula boonei 6A8]|jgi:two-component system sensor histidine kinase KdpD|uniref:Osmosensitive K+ channel His kinase sensor n=1 Tax=Methanoregula boonei (strain DSM 21154 / JCM 14090 / 6A8) TaxID=456442 RepID=A7I6Q3_METB6|nr:sensor histidine kinase KdpD [Methanoregula boonei]ABS55414.1 Osmosensitive K+ channel His kinase sensor [Methanoregula boonei 6A8]
MPNPSDCRQDQRPDPDALLACVQKEELQKVRGKLKIFLGYIAGVGKTYEMLKAAHLRKDEGVDVRIGYIEPHGRKETEALMEGIPVIPNRTIEYHGVKLNEMDLDAILAAHPQLVLVDELAHTNVPGSRHLKRYQDVEELLAAGIDVYSTLNVQHIESLNDVVARITGVIIKEKIPDRVIDEAAEIEVVDLAPPELLQRLREGKVYVPEMAARAIEQFFNEGNLYALRELALRRAAERVDNQMLAYMQTRSIPGPWAVGEYLLVCIGPGPLAERLIRTARRQADRINARWCAIYVETPTHHRLSLEAKEQVDRSLQLAEKLGATTASVFGLNVANTVLEYARQHNVTRIIIGKTLRPRWQEFVFGSVVDQLIHNSGPIDVYVISSGKDLPEKPAEAEPLLPASPPRDYVDSLTLVVAVTILGWLFHSLISPVNQLMFYLLAVVVIAFKRGLKPAIFTSVVGVLAFDFFFVPPYLTFRVSDTQYLVTFLGMIIVGSVISLLVARARRHADAAQTRERETSTLYALSQDLAGALDADAIMNAVGQHIKEIFQWESAFFLPENGHLAAHAKSPGLVMDGDDLAVATWAFQHGTTAGYDTDTLHGSKLRYIPLRSTRGVLGIMAVQPAEANGVITYEQSRILTAFANQAALALERVNLAKPA